LLNKIGKYLFALVSILRFVFSRLFCFFTCLLEKIA